MRDAGAPILRDTSTGLLSTAMVQSFPSLCLCTLRLLYRAHVSGFIKLDVAGPANSSVRNSHSDRFEVSRFDSVVSKVEHAPEVQPLGGRGNALILASGLRRPVGCPIRLGACSTRPYAVPLRTFEGAPAGPPVRLAPAVGRPVRVPAAPGLLPSSVSLRPAGREGPTPAGGTENPAHGHRGPGGRGRRPGRPAPPGNGGGGGAPRGAGRGHSPGRGNASWVTPYEAGTTGYGAAGDS